MLKFTCPNCGAVAPFLKGPRIKVQTLQWVCDFICYREYVYDDYAGALQAYAEYPGGSYDHRRNKPDIGGQAPHSGVVAGALWAEVERIVGGFSDGRSPDESMSGE